MPSEKQGHAGKRWGGLALRAVLCARCLSVPCAWCLAVPGTAAATRTAAGWQLPPGAFPLGHDLVRLRGGTGTPFLSPARHQRVRNTAQQ